ncbi:Uncharacterised protein [Mycobacteroides abscessus subsp. abscessus]|nr:Uncharacterised protein [Mycobacteroides abscessus subsp. abscessus]
MKTVYLETELPTDADRVWNAMQYAGCSASQRFRGVPSPCGWARPAPRGCGACT